MSQQGTLTSLPRGGLAVVIASSGAIGGALLSRLRSDGGFAQCIGFSRAAAPCIDLTSEASIAGAASHIAKFGTPLRVVINAAGFLHGDGFMPEKSWRQLDAAHMANAFAINTIGPALLMKHLLPLLPREGKAVFATLSAKVGSLGDNHLGGWYTYRASKAALNQLVRTAAIELKRRQPQAVCVALHPGTVASKLSEPFRKDGLHVLSPSEAADQLLQVIDKVEPADSGGFFDYRGEALPW